MAKYIANSFEENSYHDSYFYHVIFNTDDNSISTHTYASTAFGVSPDQFSDCSPLPDELKSSYTQAVKEKALSIINEHQDTIVGDTVEVVEIVNKKIIGIDIGITKMVEVSIDNVMTFEDFTKTFYGDLHEQY